MRTLVVVFLLPFVANAFKPVVESSNIECSLHEIPTTVSTANKEGNCVVTIMKKFCGGFCESSEKGTHIFPYRNINASICLYTSLVEKTAPYQCDYSPSPESELPVYTYVEPTGCQCTPCSSDNQVLASQAHNRKRRTIGCPH
uniref:Cys_knot domain-containing protein n=1 Tax=Steinernema glaseri TaxID=37863 RepID=A0A1I7YYB4_9BILA